MAHWSDCALHNAPALAVGPCDCGNNEPGFDARTNLAALRSSTVVAPELLGSAGSAGAALSRIAGRSGEDVGEWAERLAGDLAAFTD